MFLTPARPISQRHAQSGYRLGGRCYAYRLGAHNLPAGRLPHRSPITHSYLSMRTAQATPDEQKLCALGLASEHTQNAQTCSHEYIDIVTSARTVQIS